MEDTSNTARDTLPACVLKLQWVAWLQVQGGDNQLYAAWVSPAFTCVLLFFVSGVRLVEAAGDAKWGAEPEYRNYMQNTSCIIPWCAARGSDMRSKV